MTQVWKMYLLPGKKCENGKRSPLEKRYKAFDYMRDHGVVGWQTKKVETTQESFKLLDDMLKKNNTRFKTPIIFIKNLKKDDLVWVHDGRKNKKQYYLCKITSDFKQLGIAGENTQEAQLDMGWVRNAEWREVDSIKVYGRHTVEKSKQNCAGDI